MSFIVIAGTPEADETRREYTTLRDRIVDQHGTQFWEDYMNGFINLDGSPTEETIRAEEMFGY